MSRWTHVAGIIRVDAIPIPPFMPSIRDVEAAFGENIPEGSEGPIKVSVYPYSFSDYNVCFCQVIIYGDLRDFGEIEEIEQIIEWIEQGCKKLKEKYYVIRQGVVQIDDEYGNLVIMHTTGEEWDKMWIKESEE